MRPLYYFEKKAEMIMILINYPNRLFVILEGNTTVFGIRKLFYDLSRTQADSDSSPIRSLDQSVILPAIDNERSRATVKACIHITSLPWAAMIEYPSALSAHHCYNQTLLSATAITWRNLWTSSSEACPLSPSISYHSFKMHRELSRNTTPSSQIVLSSIIFTISHHQ